MSTYFGFNRFHYAFVGAKHYNESVDRQKAVKEQ